MTAPKEVRRLVERFRENREAYLSGEYNETQLRREFLDPAPDRLHRQAESRGHMS